MNKFASQNILIGIFLCLFSNLGFAADCQNEDFENFVSSEKGCIGIQAWSEIDKSKTQLVIFLHGDYWAKVKEFSERFYLNFSKRINASIDTSSANIFFLARPGWTTPSGNKSDGGDPKGHGWGDNYIWKRDIKPVGHAIQNLKEFPNYHLT